MKERPILFSGEMVRAILEGRKTQTRRVIKPQPREDSWGYSAWPRDDSHITWDDIIIDPDYYIKTGICPYGQPGDKLFVRESCRAEELPSGLDGVRYVADDAFVPIENTMLASERWGELFIYRGNRGAIVPPIHQPRWASRITLDVTRVRVARVQDISEEEMVKEGIVANMSPTHAPYWRQNVRHHFIDLWDSINAKRGYDWDVNPWVWVVEFRVVTP